MPFEAFAKDYKNPLLRNTSKRLVTIDSSFRTIMSDTTVFYPKSRIKFCNEYKIRNIYKFYGKFSSTNKKCHGNSI